MFRSHDPIHLDVVDILEVPSDADAVQLPGAVCPSPTLVPWYRHPGWSVIPDVGHFSWRLLIVSLLTLWFLAAITSGLYTGLRLTWLFLLG